jgi:hypothetical protein
MPKSAQHNINIVLIVNKGIKKINIIDLKPMYNQKLNTAYV